MRFRSAILLLFCMLFILIPAFRSSAINTPLRVNEAATRVSLRETSAEVALAVENLTAEPIRVKLELEWLDPKDNVPNRTGRVENILPGASKLKIPFPLYNYFRDSDTPWFRLRYRITSDEEMSKPFAPVTGIISLSEMAQEMFELHVIASDFAVPGKLYRAQVRALHPVNAKPIAGVHITSELKFDNDAEDKFTASGITDRNGLVSLSFNLPQNLKPEDGTLNVTGKLGEYTQESEFDLSTHYARMARIILTTDKPLYQPGQTLHIRALALDFHNRAIPDTELEIEVEDPEHATQFRTNLKTSRFGVANADWTIPDGTRLGDFNIKASLDDEDHGEGESFQTVKITRYELPNFAVKTKPNRGYYLPGQNAEVEIRADYLFGQPVTKAKVRVVRETERQWNYKLQKWESNEAESFEGEADATGKFTAKIDLTNAHKDFADETYRRFNDLSYAAYFTDQTTGRTEQKRFDLRVTREPIHVYFIGGNYSQAKGLPVQFYVSASYADGTPAVCDIAISKQIEKDNSAGGKEEFAEQQLRTVRTNRFGIAKVSELALPVQTEDDEFALGLTANDSKGATGHHTENLRLSDDAVVRLRMSKAIFLKGEPIELRLISNRPNAVAVLSVAKGFEILLSQTVRLRNGKAYVVLPYRPEFNDVLSISALIIGERDSNSANSRSVIYPHDHELKLDVALDRAEYRPGDEATARFRALTGEGLPVESALGISVVDRAVEERARTNGEFGSRQRHDFVRSYLQDSQSVAGITVRDLQKLDVTQPISAELQLAAEILLLNGNYQPRPQTSGDFNYDQQRIFNDLTQRTLRPLRVALDRHYDKTGEYPRNRESLDRILNIAELKFDDLRDPWGNSFRAEFSTSRERDHFNVQSAGADKKFGTADDFPIYITGWLYFKPLGDVIQRTAQRLAERDGRISLDVAAFKQELKRDGLDFDSLRDRLGKPYSLSLLPRNTMLQIEVTSNSQGWFAAWSVGIEYFQPMIPRLNAALEKQFDADGSFPTSDETLYATLKAGGFEPERLKDIWGNPYYGSYLNRILRTSHVSIRFEELQKNPQAAKTPQVEKVNLIELRSKGPDGQANTQDDFKVADFVRMKLEQDGSTSAQTTAPKPSANAPIGTGAIKGVITDASGAVISNATAKAVNLSANQVYEVRSNAEGEYLIRNLPSGIYRLVVFANGFKTLSVEDVPIRSVTLTEANVVLEVGSVSETVAVSGGVLEVQTESASVSSTQIANLPLNSRNVANLLALKPGAQVSAKVETSTPRLREHFQETLVWQPQLETDKQGRARLKFKLADNITTWKLSVIGSTVDGQIGFAEKDFTAFQPFFAELDPPRV
ncbi:MAG TPA: MG2 domain-containing protein, partial [Blastocatellia bacterium]|nr:MG2 domain-containing protein [Blastocatellia bacterium]